jgi:hypothetical protein
MPTDACCVGMEQVFICQNVKHLASHLEPTECAFDQDDMPMIREQMVRDLKMGAINYH